jgi:AAA domain
MGKVDLAAVHQQMTAHEASLTLIRAGQPDHRHPQGAFTTDEMLKLERENVVLMKNRLDTHAQPIASWDEVQRWGVAKGLSQEQINAAHLALGSDKGIGAIEGFAGAAKTTTVGAVREFAEEHGYIVRGFGMTTGAVAALRDAGINARTLASTTLSKLEFTGAI